MKKDEWKKFYGEARTSARQAAIEEEIHPDARTLIVPFLLPLEAININRLAFGVGDYGELYDIILDKNGKPIHLKLGDNWRHLCIGVDIARG